MNARIYSKGTLDLETIGNSPDTAIDGTICTGYCS